MLDFDRYQWISFDCYGTLVDWETGISDAAAGLFARHGVRKSTAEILSLFADAEPRVQTSGEFLDYRRVLRDVMQIMAWEGKHTPARGGGRTAPGLPASVAYFPGCCRCVEAASDALQAGCHLQC